MSKQLQQQLNASNAAIQFALEGDEGLDFLRCWNEGDFKACREEWPEAPAECYPGADPMDPATIPFEEVSEPHEDDVAIDTFTAALKQKMAESRAKGRGGWQGASAARLTGMLRDHVEKGDPRDVALLAMMLWCNGQTIARKEDCDGEA